MTTSPGGPRSTSVRHTDTLDRLRATAADAWVATAGGHPAEPYLVPLSLLWWRERVVLATDARSRTARNLAATPRARLGLGPTRDVVVLDAVLESTVPVPEAEVGLADAYAAQADWDPRSAGPAYVFLVLRPERIQAWREVDEIAGRTLMRDGVWVG